MTNTTLPTPAAPTSATTLPASTALPDPQSSPPPSSPPQTSPPPSSSPSRASLVGLALVVLAVIPYSAMKLLWIAGSTIGILDADTAADMHGATMLIGNGITLGLEVLGVCLAVALTRPSSLRIPAWLIFVVGGGATGLLAPIALGTPIGSLLQLAMDGDLHTAGMDHMRPWVYAIAYGGFFTLAVGFTILLGGYCTRRWGRLIAEPPTIPGPFTVALGAVGLVPFGIAMLWFGLAGPGEFGPAAMTSTAQRTFVGVSGLLPLFAFLAPVIGRRAPRLAWSAVWVGCSTAVMQPIATVLLDLGEPPSPLLATIFVVTVPCAFGYGIVVLRHRLHPVSGASRESSRWIVWCARLGAAAAVPTALWRLGLAAGFTMGTPDSWRALQHIPGEGVAYVTTLSVVQLAAAVGCLVLSVDARRFTPPRLVGGIGLVGGAMLTVLVVMSILAWDRVNPFAGQPVDGWNALCAACYLSAVAWPASVVPASLGYLRRGGRLD